MPITKHQGLNHDGARPGKIEVSTTKPCRTQRDLSLAYTPGVAYLCLEIQKNPHDVFKYSARGNLVAVVTNGSAVLGLGDIGALPASQRSKARPVRWGHFSYAVPVAPGKYTLILHFIERSRGSVPRGDSAPWQTNGEPEGRVFSVFCNGKAVVRGLNILKEVGTNRPLLRTIAGLEPNAQGKLLLEFEPVKGYATLTAIEVLPQ